MVRSQCRAESPHSLTLTLCLSRFSQSESHLCWLFPFLLLLLAFSAVGGNYPPTILRPGMLMHEASCFCLLTADSDSQRQLSTSGPQPLENGSRVGTERCSGRRFKPTVARSYSDFQCLGPVLHNLLLLVKIGLANLSITVAQGTKDLGMRNSA